MAKKAFSEEDLAFWHQIAGKQGVGLTTADIQNTADMLEGELGLIPVVYTLRGEQVVWDDLTRQKFYNLDARRDQKGNPFRNGSWVVLYHPADCEKATGSNQNNWTQWAGALLGYGRGDHLFAPKYPLTQAVRTLLEKRGHELSGRSKGRLLSLEVVIFILGRQDRTWTNPGAVQSVRRRLRKLNPDFDLTKLTVIPDDEDLDMDALFTNADEDVSQPMATSGQAHSKPSRPYDAEIDDLIADLLDPEPEDKPMASPAPAEPISSSSLREVDEFASVSEEDLEAQIVRMTVALERKRAMASKEAREEAASQMVVLGGDVYGKLAYYRTIEVRYPDGSIRTLYDEEALPSGNKVEAVKS
jgi:hypothetical protein